MHWAQKKGLRTKYTKTFSFFALVCAGFGSHGTLKGEMCARGQIIGYFV